MGLVIPHRCVSPDFQTICLRQIVGCRQSISSDAVETETADRRLRLPLTLLAARERQRERRWEARQVTTANREAGKAM
jgi:hypothetical protein